MTHRLRLWMCVLLAGCGQSSPPAAAPTAAAPTILTPFQGRWKFSLPKATAAWEAERAPASDIAQLRQMGAAGLLPKELSFQGDTAIIVGIIEGDYRFYALHAHGVWTCGKAWHEEDRHDPGDMDKEYVRLQIQNGDLLLATRISEGDTANPADLEVTMMPLTAGSAATCGADALPTPPWSTWQTFVYEPVR